jgi:hypothetical protein
MAARLSCVYCGRQATTKDHVIPRCLLEKPYPPNIPTVPSCRPCNEGYSKDEEYFLAVMAQAGFSASLMQKVDEGGVVDRMLTRSAGLDAHFADTMNVGEDGRIFITPNEGRIANVMRKIAFGLYCHRYVPKFMPPLDDFRALKPVHDRDATNFILVMAHNERFRPRAWTHVQTLRFPERGKVQIFDYMFVRNWVWADFGKLFCIMRFHETLWGAVCCPHPRPERTLGGALASHTLATNKNWPSGAMEFASCS